LPGRWGLNGEPGFDGDSSYFGCDGKEGGHGGTGESGTAGGAGANGRGGGSGGQIVFDIPDGDTNTYQFAARGGPGGPGGPGGRGGDGGQGGDGGDGGDAYWWLFDEPAPHCSGGNGGAGGTGGNGSTGGRGGDGGTGGSGGAITVTYPAQGFDPAWISVDASAGPGGPGGIGGSDGSRGWAGAGGAGGFGCPPCDGQDGWPGPHGSEGQPGFSGQSGTGGGQGSAGTATVTRRGNPNLSVTPSTGSVTAGGSVTATVSAAAMQPPQTVTLSAAGLPAEASVSFNPAAISTGASSTMTITTTASMPAGNYTVTVTGAAGSGVATINFTLTVIGPPTGCAATNTTDTPLSQGSPIVISGCGVSGPLVATVEVHVKDTTRAHLSIDLVDPEGHAQQLLSSVLADPLDFRHTVDETYRVVVHGAPANGQWLLWHPNGSIVDQWTITLTPVGPPVPFGPHRIVAVHSGGCLDVSGASTADGAQVHQWGCHGGANQQWQIQPLGSDQYRLVAVHSGKCLEVVHAGDNAAINQQPCNVGWLHTSWLLTPVGTGTYALVSPHSNKCLEVSGAALHDGATIRQSSCHLGNHQQWQLNP
jgi:ricin-type beta-trefoil lectin protein/proprotein convertase P-domain-containing protein